MSAVSERESTTWHFTMNDTYFLCYARLYSHVHIYARSHHQEKKHSVVLKEIRMSVSRKKNKTGFFVTYHITSQRVLLEHFWNIFLIYSM